MNPAARTDVDGRIAQGWGGTSPNGVHVNVILARRGSPTAAAMITAFAAPSPGFCPIGVPVGPDQPSYETVNPPVILLNKVPVDGFAETLVFGAATVGTAQGVLDCVADELLEADQETVVFVALWVDPAADDETAVKHAARAVTDVLRIELVGKPVRVSEVDPGLVETEFSLVRFDGDEERADSVYEGLTPLSAGDVADVIAFVATRPSHVDIDQVVIRPRAQARVWLVHRESS